MSIFDVYFISSLLVHIDTSKIIINDKKCNLNFSFLLLLLVYFQLFPNIFFIFSAVHYAHFLLFILLNLCCQFWFSLYFYLKYFFLLFLLFLLFYFCIDYNNNFPKTPFPFISSQQLLTIFNLLIIFIQ